jgi:hypothetical protein
MGEQEEGREENVDVELATSFFKAMLAYFKQNPKGLTVLLHNISENLINEIIENGELSKMLGYTAGQLNVVSDLIWNHDDEEIIQHALTNSPNLEDILSAIARLAWAYSRLVSSTEVIPGDIEGLIKEAASTLYRIIEHVITDTGSDP